MFTKKKFSSEALEQLKAKVTGSVVSPGDADYDKQRTPWLEVVKQRPSAIVNAHTVTASFRHCERPHGSGHRSGGPHGVRS